MKIQQPSQGQFVCIQVHLFSKSEDLSLIFSPKLSIYTKVLLVQCLVSEMEHYLMHIYELGYIITCVNIARYIQCLQREEKGNTKTYLDISNNTCLWEQNT